MLNNLNAPLTASVNVGNQTGASMIALLRDPSDENLPTPKHLVHCPFLRRRGYCLKGPRGDFLHTDTPTPRPLPSFQPYDPPRFFHQTPHPYRSFPPVMSFPFFLPFMHQPDLCLPPLMGTSTRPPTPPLMGIPTRLPLC